MKKGFGILLIVLGFGVALVFLLSFLWLPPQDYTHTGKGLFTEEQYLEFKTTMASEDIEIERIEILGNNYPILIDYKFTSKDKASIWGEGIKANKEVDIMLWSLTGLFLIIPGGMILIGEEN